MRIAGNAEVTIAPISAIIQHRYTQSRNTGSAANAPYTAV